MGREGAAREFNAQGAMYSAILDESVCPLCRSLDKLECRMFSDEYYTYSPQNHSRCRCIWIFVGVEEEGWRPDASWQEKIQERASSFLGVDISYADFMTNFGMMNPAIAGTVISETSYIADQAQRLEMRADGVISDLAGTLEDYDLSADFFD